MSALGGARRLSRWSRGRDGVRRLQRQALQRPTPGGSASQDAGHDHALAHVRRRGGAAVQRGARRASTSSTRGSRSSRRCSRTPANDTFDPNLINAIKGGNAPDVALPFGPDYVGQYCSSGLWQDLTPYMQRDDISISDFAPAAVTLHQLRRQAVRAAVADRRLRPLLQQGHAREGGHHVAAQDDERADGRRQEADRQEPRRLDQGRRVRPAEPVGGARPADLGRAWGAQWFDSERQSAARHRSRLDERASSGRSS